MPMKGREHSQEYHLGLLWETLAHLEAEACGLKEKSSVVNGYETKKHTPWLVFGIVCCYENA